MSGRKYGNNQFRFSYLIDDFTKNNLADIIEHAWWMITG